jgi:AcrR family transcriptional regulator
MSESRDAAPEFNASGQSPAPGGPSKPTSARDRIIEATMELAAERDWDQFSLSDLAERAGVSLAEFRDAFPSKGAVLAGLSRKIDRAVLEGSTKDMSEESAKERLFDVLMRRLDAMGPYKLGLEGLAEHVRKDPLTAAALNRVALNSMRFMLEAAGINTEKQLGAVKIQGLVLAWMRVLNTWFKDDDPGLARTMAALDRELSRGEVMSARLDDLDRLIGPLRILGRSMLDARQRFRDKGDRRGRRHGTTADLDPSI